MSEKKMPEPMDAGAPERQYAEPTANNQRTAGAIKQLLEEALLLFPETQYQVVNFNGRNVGLSVVFDCIDGGQDLTDLLLLTTADSRVNNVVASDGSVTVSLHNRPRTYDLRDSFGLNEGWLVLAEYDGAGEQDADTWEGGEADQTTPDVQDGGGA